ncbi:MAG: hypothetical protein QME52_06245 [Bacteroidota bacterium]|nr:hypothetical protein [Bacteroidota bacterium]
MLLYWIISFLTLVDPASTVRQQDSLQTVSVPDSIDHHYSLGVGLFDTHDDSGESREQAKKEFQIVLKLNPHHAPAISYLGFIAMDEDSLDLADSLFKSAVRIDSTCPEARVGRANFFRRIGQWQAGYDEARNAVKLAPSSILARWELVSQLLHRAEAPVTEVEINEAIPHLKKIIELDSNARGAHLDLAESYERLKQWREAVIHYSEVLHIGQIPEDMDVWVYMVHLDVVRCLENLHEYSEALHELQLYLDELRKLQADEETIKEIEQRIHKLQNKIKK